MKQYIFLSENKLYLIFLNSNIKLLHNSLLQCMTMLHPFPVLQEQNVILILHCLVFMYYTYHTKQIQATIRYLSSFLCIVCNWFAHIAAYKAMCGQIRAPNSAKDKTGLRAIPPSKSISFCFQQSQFSAGKDMAIGVFTLVKLRNCGWKLEWEEEFNVQLFI